MSVVARSCRWARKTTKDKSARASPDRERSVARARTRIVRNNPRPAKMVSCSERARGQGQEKTAPGSRPRPGHGRPSQPDRNDRGQGPGPCLAPRAPRPEPGRVTPGHGSPRAPSTRRRQQNPEWSESEAVTFARVALALAPPLASPAVTRTCRAAISRTVTEATGDGEAVPAPSSSLSARD